MKHFKTILKFTTEKNILCLIELVYSTPFFEIYYYFKNLYQQVEIEEIQIQKEMKEIYKVIFFFFYYYY